MLLCCSRTRKCVVRVYRCSQNSSVKLYFFDLERWETQSNQVAHEWWNLGSFVIVLSEFWYIECLAFRRNAVWDFWVLKVSAFGNLKPFLYDISYYVILYMCSILKWCCPCRICLHLHVNTVNTTRRIPMAQGFLHVSLWLGCFSLKDLILQHILEYFFHISHHSLWYELLQIKDTQWNVILKLLLISLMKLTDEWQTLVFYVLGLKLP